VQPVQGKVRAGAGRCAGSLETGVWPHLPQRRPAPDV